MASSRLSVINSTSQLNINNLSSQNTTINSGGGSIGLGGAVGTKVVNVTGGLSIVDTTASTSNSTGALISAGGISISLATDATSSTNGGALTLAGGAAFAKSVFVGTTLTATTLAGTLSTAAQSNVTSLGTLTSLTVSGATNLTGTTDASSSTSGGVLTVSGGGAFAKSVFVGTTLTATTLAGTLSTAAQTNITSVGTLTGLTVSGAVSFTNSTDASSSTIGGALTVSGGGAFAKSVFVGTTLTATTLAGTISTAAQTNITSVGTLTGLTVSGTITSSGTTASTSPTTGTVLLSGGLGINNATDATSSANGGSLTSAGGASFAKSMFIGTNLTVGGNLTVNGTTTITNTSTISITNNTIILNSAPAGTGYDSGILTYRYQVDNSAGTGDVVTDTPKTTFSLTAATASNITLPAGASASDNFYNNWWINIASGTATGQVRQITAYNGTTKVATLDNNFSTTPSAGDNVNLYDKSYSVFLWQAATKRFITAFAAANTQEGALTIIDYADLQSNNIIGVSTTGSTSNSTGALTLAGGIGISLTTDATSSTNGGTLTSAGGAAFAKSVFVGTTLTATTLAGTLSTAAQTNVTSVGTLTGLTVSGALSLTGTTASTSNSTGILTSAGGIGISLTTDATSSTNGGTLTSAGGAAFAKSVFVGTTLTATTLAGTLSTAAQPNVTSLGTLTGLTVSGTISSTGTTATTSNSSGIITTAGGIGISNTTDATSSTNGGTITSAGGAAFAKSVFVGTTLTATTLAGTLSTSAQTNVTSLGTLTALTVSGALSLTGTTVSSSNSTGILTSAGGIGISLTTDAVSSTNGGTFTSAGGGAFAKSLYVGTTLTATTLAGTLSTAAQTNITSVGTLTSLTVSGTVNFTGTTDATNSATGGTLTISGGTAIAKSLYVGTSINSASVTVTGSTGVIISTTSSNTSTNATPLQMLAASLNTGFNVQIPFGVATNNFNSGILQFNYVTTGTASANYVGLGLSGATNLLSLYGTGQLKLAPTAYSGTPSVTGALTAFQATTFTDNSTVASGTTTSMVFNSFAQPTLAASNTSVTTTTAATVYIAGGPLTGTNETITSSYGLWNAGGSRFDGVAVYTGTTASTSNSTGIITSSGGIGISLATDATSSTNGGTFTSAGGGAFAKSLYVGTTLTATTLTGTISTASQPNITSLGTLSSLSISSASVGPLFSVNSSATSSGNQLASILSPSLTAGSGNYSYIVLGVANSTNNGVTLKFVYNASGSTSNYFSIVSPNVGELFDFYYTGQFYVPTSITSTSNSTGSIITTGGIASSNTTDASSSTNGGTFTSAGGGAFAKSIWAGTTLNAGSGINNSGQYNGTSTTGVTNYSRYTSGSNLIYIGIDGTGLLNYNPGHATYLTQQTLGAHYFYNQSGFLASFTPVTGLSCYGVSITSNTKTGTPSVTGAYVSVVGSTFQDTNTAASGTATSMVFNSFGQPTLSASNTSVTTTNAATVYIAGNVLAGTNDTLTNSYGLWNVGATRLDGAVVYTGTTSSTSSTTGIITSSGGIGISLATDATSSTNGGTFTTAGGIAATKSIWAGTSINAATGSLSSATIGPVLTVSSSATSSANQLASILSPSLTAGSGNYSYILFGVANSTNNAAVIKFVYNASGSTTNYLSIVSPNVGELFDFYYTGQFYVPTSITSTSNSTGSIITTGGIASSNTTDASSSTNGGTFTSAGGGAFAKSLYVGTTLTATTLVGTLSTASQTNITSVGTLTSLTVSASSNPVTVNATGSTTGAALSINGSNTTSSFVPLQILAGSLNTGLNVQIPLGVSLANYNCSVLQFNYNGSGSSTGNTLGLGFYGANNLQVLYGTGKVTFNPTSYSGTPSASLGAYFQANSATFTDNNTVGSGTATAMIFNSFAQPTLAASNTSVTTTNATTVYIAGGPSAGTNETITNSYGLWNVGNTRFDGSAVYTGTTASTSSSTGIIISSGGIGISLATDATSSANGGTFTSAGGGAFAKSLWVGTTLTATTLTGTISTAAQPNITSVGTLSSLSISSTSAGSLLSVSSSATTNGNNIASFLTPSISTGNYNYLLLGVANSTNNGAVLKFVYNASGSTSNYFSIVSPGVGELFDFYYTGQFYVPTSITSTSNSTGSIITTGGIASSNTTDASSSTNGGNLTLAGGAAVGKTLYVGTKLLVNFGGTGASSQQIVVCPTTSGGESSIIFEQGPGGAGSGYWILGQAVGGIGSGNFSLTNSSGNVLTASGSTGIVNFPQGITKGSGSFDIAHPDPVKADKGYRLKHAFVESATRGDTIYRFKITTEKCKANIELPDYFNFLNENPQVFISPVDVFGVCIYQIDSEMKNVSIQANLEGTYNILIIGTRKDKIAKEFFDKTEIEYISDNPELVKTYK